MPVLRVANRRRSSLAAGLSAIRAGKYGVSQLSPRSVTFAPNVTPGTYVEPELSLEDNLFQSGSTADALFTPSEEPAPEPTRRRNNRKKPAGHIPRPANAFMLFRADFVRQKHVPGSIETDHGSLSKIIGTIWRSLPPESKRVWEALAQKTKADHKRDHPDYRYRPIHKKKDPNAEVPKRRTGRARGRQPYPIPDEQRIDDLSQLLLDGHKGEDLAEAVRQLDNARTQSRTPVTPDPFFSIPPQPHASTSQIQHPVPLYAQRRSSSVPPLAGPIALPSIPFFSDFTGGSRAPSPVYNISRSQRFYTRRASSAQPIPSRSWTEPEPMFSNISMPENWLAQREPEVAELPEINASIFRPEYTTQEGTFTFPSTTSPFAQNGAQKDWSFNNYSHSHHPSLSLSISPLEGVPPLDMSPFHENPYSAVSSAPSPVSAYSYHAPTAQMSQLDLSGANWVSNSGPSSAFSGSPAMSDLSLPSGSGAQGPSPAGVLAPQPMHAQGHAPAFETWAPQQPQPEVCGEMFYKQFGLDSQFGHDQEETQYDDAQFAQAQYHESQQSQFTDSQLALALQMGSEAETQVHAHTYMQSDNAMYGEAAQVWT